MNQLEQEIEKWLGPDGCAPSAERVAELMECYPYFTLPAAVALDSAVADVTTDEANRWRRHVALNTPDHEALRAILDPDDKEFVGFYPDKAPDPVPSTIDTIDKFISTYGHSDPNEEAVLMRMIFNPTPDYAQVLAAEEERSAPSPEDAPEGSHDQLINDFILKTRASSQRVEDAVQDPVPAPEDAPVAPVAQQPTHGADESMLTESLAKMYIGQRRYAKAYEIISNLNLNFPEKSIYFADQLRFLQKLMLAQKYAKPTENDN